METPEELLLQEETQEFIQEDNSDSLAGKPRLARVLIKTGAVLLFLTLFLGLLAVVFMSHTYSYHL